jgi:hypothetical protein
MYGGHICLTFRKIIKDKQQLQEDLKIGKKQVWQNFFSINTLEQSDYYNFGRFVFEKAQMFCN